MTRQKSFKRLVRARMAKTGESYTAARATLLAADGKRSGDNGPEPVLVTSDENIRRRTGRGWEEWFDLLDEWGADTLTHRDIVRRVAAELDIEPLVWEAQAVTYSYERSRGLRAAGERADGFAITVSRTVDVPVGRLYEAFADPTRRADWLLDPKLDVRTATEPRSIRFDWDGGTSRVHVAFDVKGEAKTTVAVEHARLRHADEAEQMKAWWRKRLTALKSQLEAGEPHA